MGIQHDLAIGKIGEKRVVKLFQNLGNLVKSVEINEDKQTRAFYDISVEFLMSNHIHLLFIEVKNDVYANKSGNIAIETYNPRLGKPSGIGITKSHLWVHITDGIYLANTSTLKQFITDNKPHRIITAGGDQNATLFLYRADYILQQCFHRVDTMEPQELYQLVVLVLNLDSTSFSGV
jgi:hypothetical protein